MQMTEGEKWARIVIFLLVGVYSVVVFILTVKYMFKNYFCPRRNRSTRHLSRGYHECSCHRHRNFFSNFYDDDDLPHFEAALRYPAPNSKAILEIEQPPPSYDEYIKSMSQNTLSSTLTLNPDTGSTNYLSLDIDEVKVHM